MAKLEDELHLVDLRLPAGSEFRDVDQEVAGRVVRSLDGDLLVAADAGPVADALPAVRARGTRSGVVVARVDGHREAGRRRRNADRAVRLRLARIHDHSGAGAGRGPAGLGVVVDRLLRP